MSHPGRDFIMPALRKRRVTFRLADALIHVDLVMGDADNPEDEARQYGISDKAVFVDWSFIDEQFNKGMHQVIGENQ